MKKSKYVTLFKLIVISLLASLAINPVTIFAESVNDTEKNISELFEVTEDVIENMALDFSRSTKPGIDFKVDNIVKMYDSDENAFGYSVGFFANGKKHGYAIFDFRIPGYIKEFSLESETKDFYESIIETAEEKNIMIDNNVYEQEAKMYELAPLQYTVEVNGSEVVTNTDEILTAEQFETEKNSSASKNSNYENGDLVDENSLGGTSKYDSQSKVLLGEVPRAYQITKFASWRQFIPSVEAQVEKLIGKWACGVTALDIVAKGTGLEWDTKKSYPLLWDYSKTTVTQKTNGITYGSTSYTNMGPAFQSFAKKYRKNVTYSHGYNPSFSNFRGAIDGKKPAILGYGIISGGKRVGHFVTVEGYCLTNNANVNFLVVADGWFESARYINYNTSNFADTFGTFWSGITVIH